MLKQMKKLLYFMVVLLLGLSGMAQDGNRFNYQAVVRDASGGILPNKQAVIDIEIIKGTVNEQVIYTEQWDVQTTALGLVNLEIGSGDPETFEEISWASEPYFISVTIDGEFMGKSQLLSVPFAMKAISSVNDQVDDADADPQNEIELPTQSIYDKNRALVADGYGNVKWKTISSSGSVSVVNDLTTGGTDKALAAEQGKTLKTLVDAKLNKSALENSLSAGGTDKALTAEQGKKLYELLGDKVDKVNGKGLSTNDFTDTEKYRLADAEIQSNKNQANGYAGLNGDKKIDVSQLPAMTINNVYPVSSQAAQLALSANQGDVAIRTDLQKNYIHNGGVAGTMGDWTELASPNVEVTSVNGKTGNVMVEISDIGNLQYELLTKASASETYTRTQTDGLLDTKIDKESGKRLSTNDLTDDLKLKLEGAEEVSNKNQANGYAGLDANKKIDASQLPAITINNVFPVDSEAAQLALSANTGDIAIRSDNNKNYIHNGETAGDMTDWTEMASPNVEVTSVNAKTGDVVIGIADIATLQTELDAKLAKASLVDDLTSGGSDKPLTAEQGKELKSQLDGKVDKETGKILSSNDYTDAEKNKLAGAEIQSNKNQPNGYVGLDAAKKIDVALLPDITINNVFTATSEAEQLAFVVKLGDVVIRNDIKRNYIHNGGTSGTMADWAEMASPDIDVTSVNGKMGNVVIDIADIASLQSSLDAKAASADTYTKTESDNLLDDKVDKVTGKELSDNNYTDTEKTKLEGTEEKSNKNQANGYPGLGADGKIDVAQLPAMTINSVFSVASQAEQLALSATTGDIAIRSDNNKNYIHNGGSAGDMTDWTEMASPSVDVTSVNSKTGAVVIGISDIATLQGELDAKVAKTDLVDDLTTGGTNKALTAEQGKALKTLIDAKAATTDLAPIATSGSFNDLVDLPTNLDTDSSDDFDGSFNNLTDVPANLDVDGTDDLTTADLVNNLSSGGTGKALTAEQGKVLNTLLSGKVDQETGKGLSENDFTTADKLKLDGAEQVSNKNVPNGYAGLDSNKKIDASQLPAITINSVYSAADEAEQLALSANQGDVAIRTDENKNYIHNGGNTGTIADWTEMASPNVDVLTVNGKTGNVTIDIADIANLQSSLDEKAASADTYTKSESDNLLDDKVDKVSGKELSDNNYTDAEKTKLAGAEIQSNKNQANGYPGLGADGKIDVAQLPAITTNSVYPVSNETEQLALSAHTGDIAIRSDINKNYIHNGGTAGDMTDWTEMASPDGAVTSVNTKTGDVVIGISDIATLQGELDGKLTSSDIIDNITSDNTDKALSAKQGKELKALIDAKVTTADLADIATSGSYNDLTDLPANLDTDASDDFDGSFNSLTDVPANLDTDASDDLSTGDIINNLTAGGTAKALSAEQGKILKGLLDDKVDKEAGKGLSDNNYTDAEKTKLAGAEEKSNKDQANGYAGLDANSKIDAAQLPEMAIDNVFTVPDEAAQTSLTAEKGDMAIRTDESKNYVHNGGSSGTMADWTELLAPAAAVTAVNSKTGNVVIGIADIASLQSELDARATLSETYTITESDNLLDDKVDKVSGKGLSENDFTNAEKTKLAGAEEKSNKNQANGYPGLGADGKIDAAQLPAITTNNVYSVSSEAEQLALSANSGDIAIRSDINKNFIHNGGTAGDITDWTEMASPDGAVTSVNTKTGDVVIGIADIASLQSELDDKLPKANLVNDLTTGGTSSALTAEQGKELKTLLDDKADLDSPTFTGTPSLPTGATAVTQTVGDNSTKLATTAFVSAMAAASNVPIGDGAGKMLYWDNVNTKWDQTDFIKMMTTSNTAININNSSYPYAKLNVNAASYAAPATSGTTQAGGAIRIGSPSSAVVMDIGTHGGIGGTWIQSTTGANLASNYPLSLNPNGGEVRIGSGGLKSGGSITPAVSSSYSLGSSSNRWYDLSLSRAIQATNNFYIHDGNRNRIQLGTSSTALFSPDGSNSMIVGNTYSQSSKSFLPTANNSMDLGNSSYKWRNLYLQSDLHLADDIMASTNFTIYDGTRNRYVQESNALTLYSGNAGSYLQVTNSSVILGANSNNGYLQLNAGEMVIRGTIRSIINNAYDLGTNSYKWRDLYLGDDIMATKAFSIHDGTRDRIQTNTAYTVLFSPGGNNLSVGNGYTYSGNHFCPASTSSYDLGISTHRWKTIYATNGTINTSDRSLKKNIKDLPAGLIKAISKLRPVEYEWKENENGKHIGFIAQEVEAVFAGSGLNPKEYFAIQQPDEESEYYSLVYSEFVAAILGYTQQVEKRVETLEAELEAIKAHLGIK